MSLLNASSWESGSFLLEKSQQPAPTHGAIDLPLTVALLLTKA
jgi:hypothetical protein